MGISKVRACHPTLLQRPLAMGSKALGCVHQDKRAVEGERQSLGRKGKSGWLHTLLPLQRCKAMGTLLSHLLRKLPTQDYLGPQLSDAVGSERSPLKPESPSFLKKRESQALKTASERIS